MFVSVDDVANYRKAIDREKSENTEN